MTDDDGKDDDGEDDDGDNDDGKDNNNKNGITTDNGQDYGRGWRTTRRMTNNIEDNRR